VAQRTGLTALCRRKHLIKDKKKGITHEFSNVKDLGEIPQYHPQRRHQIESSGRFKSAFIDQYL